MSRLLMMIGPLQEASNLASHLPAVVGIGLLVGAVVWMWRTGRQRRAHFLSAMASSGLLSLGNRLPDDFPVQTNVWQPDVVIRDCFAGRFNGFETALFGVTIGAGKSSVSRRIVAIKRSPFTPTLNPFMARLVKVETTSAPGWLVASTPGRFMRAEVARVLLREMTACSAFAPAPVHAPATHP